MSKLLRAKRKFTYWEDDRPKWISKGEVAESGAPIVQKYPEEFVPLTVDHPAPSRSRATVEEATDSPGKPRTISRKK